MPVFALVLSPPLSSLQRRGLSCLRWCDDDGLRESVFLFCFLFLYFVYFKEERAIFRLLGSVSRKKKKGKGYQQEEL
jgi:hypothetical protein